jgi:predicted RNase H-like HicB family nuclease
LKAYLFNINAIIVENGGKAEYRAYVPGIEELHTHGRTPEETAQNICVAISDYVMARVRDGESVPGLEEKEIEKSYCNLCTQRILDTDDNAFLLPSCSKGHIWDTEYCIDYVPFNIKRD